MRTHSRRSPPVAALLAGLVAIVIVPSTLLAAGLVWHGYQRARAQTIESALGTAHLLAARVDRRLAELVPALQVLASSPALAKGDHAEFLLHARRFLAANTRAVNVTLIDASGVQVVNTLRDPAAPPATGHPEIVALLKGGEVAITNLFIGPVLGEPLVAVAVPAHVEGQSVYAVGAGLRPRSLDDLVQSPLPASWTVAILDRHGLIVSRRPWRDEFIGQSATPELAAAVRSAASGALHGRTKEGSAVLAAFSRAPQSGYSVAIGVPEQELLAPVRREALVAGGVILGVLLVSLAVAGHIAARVASAIRHLSDSALDVHKGHTAGAPPLAFREAEQLRLGLNISAAELQQTYSELRELRDETAAQQVALAAAAIEPGSQPMLLVDAQGFVMALNRAARSAFGSERASAGELHVHELFTPDEGACGEAVAGRAWLEGGHWGRAVLRSSRLPAGELEITCVAIELADPAASITP